VVTRSRASTPPPDEQPKAPDLLLDRLDALRVLRADGDAERDTILTQIGGAGKVERDIMVQLAAVRPLRYPGRFEEAHRMMMRAIEVLDRNGARQASVRPLGPITPVAGWLIQLVTRWIVRNHQQHLLRDVCGIYERREANTEWGSPERAMLRRARMDATRVRDGMKSNALGLPTFLLGGAVITSVFSGIQSLARTALDSRVGIVTLAVVLVTVLLALSWVALYSAAVARRRIKLATEQATKALWETIGAAGSPPRDESMNFAAYAIVLLVLSWIVVPLAVWLVVTA
jgi:hypothetical protein